MTNEEMDMEMEQPEEEVVEKSYPYTEERVGEDEFKELDLYFSESTVYKMKEKPFRVFKNIQKSVTRPDGQVNSGDMITKLIAVSLVEPKLKDNEVDELPSSKAMALTGAVAKLYNLKNLQDDFM